MGRKEGFPCRKLEEEDRREIKGGERDVGRMAQGSRGEAGESTGSHTQAPLQGWLRRLLERQPTLRLLSARNTASWNDKLQPIY